MSSKPTIKEVEEYMASLNIPMEQRLNGTTKADIQCSTCKHNNNGGLCNFTRDCKEYSAWESRTNTSYDVISKPKHYMLFDETYIKNCSELELGIEVRDVLANLVGKFYKNCENLPDQPSCSLFESDYVQLMQYLMRFMDKNGVEDLKKARWYLDKLIESY